MSLNGDPARAAGTRRILLATNHLMVGGAERQLLHLAAALVRRGDDVRILSLLPTAAYQDETDAMGVPILVAPQSRPRAPTYIGFCRRVVREWKPDAVVSFLYQANIVARVGGRLGGAPIIISSFRNERFGHGTRELVLRLTDRLATMSTTNSRTVAESLVRRKVVPADRIVVIPNGTNPVPIDDARDGRGAVREALGVATGDFVWLAVSRLEPQKDLDTLLAAFAQHHREQPKARLFVAGGGRLRDELEHTAATLGVAGAAEFLGIRDDVPALLHAADALVQSSAWEGLPNAVMEAMTARLPVVATRVGGTAELLTDGTSGFLIPPGDPAALGDAMTRLASMPAADRARFGAAGRARIEQGFTVDKAVQQWLALIDRRHAR